MAKKINTPKTRTDSIILLSAARIEDIYVIAQNRPEPEPVDPTETEEIEIDALTDAILSSSPVTRDEAVAIFNVALEQVHNAADGVPTCDPDVIFRALKAVKPLLCAA